MPKASWLLLLALAFLFGAAPARAADAPTMEVVKSEGDRTVELVPDPSTQDLTGETTLFVRLKAHKKDAPAKDPLGVRFVLADKSAEELLCGEEHPRIFLNDKPIQPGCSFEPVQVGGAGLISLRIRFSLPAAESPALIGGDLILGLNGTDEGLPIPVAGTRRQFKEVSVNPASPLILSSDDAEAQVTLSGADVVPFLRSAGSKSSAELRSSAGDTTTATVTFPSADKVAAGERTRAVGTVKLSDSNPPAGKYTGKVVLSDLATGGPAVEVELHSHLCILILILLAAAGAVIGGLSTRLYTLAMRRSLLLEVLRQNIVAYVKARGPDRGGIRAWNLEDIFDEDPATEPKPPNDQRLQGLPALRYSIENARSSKDLDEDADRVLDMVARIQRWLRVEPAARRLSLVSKETPGKNLPGLAWKDSRTATDTAIVLDMSRREPPSAKEADDLLRRLLEQAKWHHDFVAIWNAAHGNSAIASRLKALNKELGEAKNTEARSADEQDGLDAKLDALAATLEPTHPLPPFPSIAEPAEAQAAGISPVNWEASSNSFTGWATLDAPSYGQLTRRAATSARALSSIDLSMEWHSKQWADAGWTLLAIAVASFGYGITGYSDTWGSCEDLAKAFLAGVTGTVAVNWAALPIFESIRLRASKPS